MFTFIHIKDVILFSMPIVYKQQANQGFRVTRQYQAVEFLSGLELNSAGQWPSSAGFEETCPASQCAYYPPYLP